MMVAPREGLLESWDRLVGPGMSRGETLLVLAASVAGLGVAAFLRGAAFDSSYALVFGVGLVGAAAVILCTPERLKTRDGMVGDFYAGINPLGASAWVGRSHALWMAVAATAAWPMATTIWSSPRTMAPTA